VSDNLLDQADALMRRRSFVAGAKSGQAESDGSNRVTDESAMEDVPVLTDVVGDVGGDDSSAGPAVTPADEGGALDLQSGAALAFEQELRKRLDQLLIERQGLLAREVETWLDEQMPQLVIRAMDGITDHLVSLLSNRAKDELLPRLEAALKPLDVSENDAESAE